jgi:death-on-curing protein
MRTWEGGLGSESVQFLSVDETIAIHELLIERFGGRSGVKDAGMLEASLYRPQTGCYEDLASMAASMFDALLFNHAFHDANHRIAFFATDVFLRLNGYRLDVDVDSASQFIETLANNDHSQRAAVLPLLRRSIVRT